jgi:hypothetical protein
MFRLLHLFSSRLPPSNRVSQAVLDGGYPYITFRFEKRREDQKACLSPAPLEFAEITEKRLRPDREAFHDQAALALPLAREDLYFLLMVCLVSFPPQAIQAIRAVFSSVPWCCHWGDGRMRDASHTSFRLSFKLFERFERSELSFLLHNYPAPITFLFCFSLEIWEGRG